MARTFASNLSSKAACRGLVAILLSTTVAGMSLAQDGTDDPGQTIRLSTVVIQAQGDAQSGDRLIPMDSATATRTDTPLERVPQVVNVIPKAQFEAQSADLITEALRYTPGVLAESNGYDIRYDWYWVRGFDAGGWMWQDGLGLPGDPTSYANPAIDPFTLERVEVVKGPASVMYGQSMPGGLVNLVSKRPQTQAANEVFLKTSGFGGYQLGGDFTGSLNKDGTLSYRLIALGKNLGSQIDRERNRRETLAPSLTWAPTDATRVTVYAYWQKDHDTFSPRFYPAAGTLLPNPAGEIPRDLFLGDPAADNFNREYAAVGYEVEHDLNEQLTVRQKLRYGRSKQDMYLVLVNPAFSWPGFPGTPGPVMNRVTAASDEELRNLTMDLSLEGKVSSGQVDHNFLVGMDYSWVRSTTAFGNSAMNVPVPGLDFTDPQYGITVTPPPFTRSNRQERRQLGIYVQDQATIGRFIATAALRHDHSIIETTNLLVPSPKVTTDDKATTGRIGVSYQFDNGVAPYAAWSSSFLPNLGTNRNGQTFESSKTRMMEIGVKYAPEGTGNLFTASLFQMTEDNFLTPDPVNPLFSVQDGKQRVRGLELEGKFALTPKIDVIAAYAYSSGKVLESSDPSVVGREMLRLPRHQGSVWVQYKDALTPGLALSAGVRGMSDYQASPRYVEALRIPGRGLVDLGVSYDLGQSRWNIDGASLQLNASNIFDRRFVTHCLNITGGSCNYGEGRAVEAKIGYKW